MEQEKGTFFHHLRSEPLQITLRLQGNRVEEVELEEQITLLLRAEWVNRFLYCFHYRRGSCLLGTHRTKRTTLKLHKRDVFSQLVDLRTTSQLPTGHLTSQPSWSPDPSPTAPASRQLKNMVLPYAHRPNTRSAAVSPLQIYF